MRPLRLALEGFTSFRDRLEIDFSGLDLFAITGPTGAGKSSLIDALVFALYGQVPRVGDEYKQLISQGRERLSVLFEFAVGEERYRVARAVRRSGPSQQNLERWSDGGWASLAGKVREIRDEVDRILGLDYDGFTRSVVLPQGQFDAFLKGEPKERRKILVALLSLSVYERMQQIANQKAAAARAEADFIKRQLETDFGSSTADALARKKAELRAAEAGVREREAAAGALAEAVSLAQHARSLRREQAGLARDRDGGAERLAAAEATLEGAGRSKAALESERQALAARREEQAFDEARHAALLAARPRAEQLVALEQAASRARRALAERGQALDLARAALAGDEAALPAAERAEAEARAAEAAARAGREEAHREHAALVLRQGLSPGDPCPVCAQAVKAVPQGRAPALDAVEAKLRKAETAARAALDRLQKARVALEQKRAKVEGLERERAQADDAEREARAAVGRARADLAAAGFEAGPDADALVEGLGAELAALEAARKARAEAEAKLRAVEQRLSKLEAEVAAAAAQRDVLRARIAEVEGRQAAVESDLEKARLALGRQAARDGWARLLPPPAGKDEADVVESLRAERQEAATAAHALVATLGQDVLATEKALARAAELAETRAGLEKEAALAKTLADHLKAHELVAWIQEEALARLAEAGSRHLLALSQGRYALRLGSGAEEAAARADQDFFVLDAWNGDAVRSVRTLSGGETFLASLALALALAESLAELGAGSRAADALESLFLDEGFGALDAETLDTVVSALDTLHGGERMVGIVTHVRELAERLPARLEVRRQGGTSSAVVV